MASPVPAAAEAVPLTDYFIDEDGATFAGRHLLIDVWDARQLTDIAHIEATLRRAAEAAKATVLDVRLHQFSDSGGISGVALLAESHISIHTWPERDFAALDVFMCGRCNPYDSVETLKAAFGTTNVTLTESRRGLIG